jgi:hypothetical protein
MYVSDMTDGLEIPTEVVGLLNFARQASPGVEEPWNMESPIDKKLLETVQQRYPVEKCIEHMSEFMSRNKQYLKKYPDCFEAIRGGLIMKEMMKANPKYSGQKKLFADFIFTARLHALSHCSRLSHFNTLYGHLWPLSLLSVCLASS